jgi:hypothetical protein
MTQIFAMPGVGSHREHIRLADKSEACPSSLLSRFRSLGDNRLPRRGDMERTPRLYETLVHVFSQHQNRLDRRHLKTLAWMMVGLMPSGNSRLTAWAPYVHRRAVYAKSTMRRFRIRDGGGIRSLRSRSRLRPSSFWAISTPRQVSLWGETSPMIC